MLVQKDDGKQGAEDGLHGKNDSRFRLIHILLAVRLQKIGECGTHYPQV